jgi:hypothetical protein
MQEKRGKISVNAIHILPIEKLDWEIRRKLEFNEVLAQHKDNKSESMYEISTIAIRRTKIEILNQESDVHNYIYKVSFKNHNKDFFFRVSVLNKDIELIKSEVFSKNENILIQELQKSGVFSYRLEPKDDLKGLGRLRYKKNFRYKLIQVNLKDVGINKRSVNKITINSTEDEEKLEQFAQLLYSESANISTLENKDNQYHTDTRKIYVFPSATVQLIFHEIDLEHYRIVNSEEKLLQQKLLDILVALSYKLFYLDMSAEVSKKLEEISRNREESIMQSKELSDLRGKLINVDADIFYINPISPTQIERFHFWNLIFQELKIKETRDLVFEQINLLGSIIQELLQNREEKLWQEWQKRTTEENNKLLNQMESLLKDIKEVISGLKQVTEEFQRYQQSYNEQKEKEERERIEEEKKEKKKEEEEKRKDAFFNLILTLFALIIGITGANTYFKHKDPLENVFQSLNNEFLLFSIVVLIPSLMGIGLIGFIMSIMGHRLKKFQVFLGLSRWLILLVTIFLAGVVGYPMYKKIADNYFKHVAAQNGLVSDVLNFFNFTIDSNQKEAKRK